MFPHKLLGKVNIVLRSQSGRIICAAGTGARYKIIQSKALRVRSMHSRSSLFSVVFMCLISPTQKFKLEKTIDSYSSYVRLFGFYTQQNVNSVANFVFTSKTGIPRVVLDRVLQWVLFVPEIFVSPLSEFEQHMHSSDPSPDTGSLMQLESRRAVPQASQPP